MIPPFTPENLLPHMLPDPMAARHGPWHCTAVEMVERFGGSEARRRYLHALLDFRHDLRDAGFVGAFQWIDGSFAEAQAADPRDLDVLTFLDSAHIEDDDAFGATVARLSWFDQRVVKHRFGLDAHLVDLYRTERKQLVAQVCRWTMLYAHRRSGEPKGWLQVAVDNEQDDSDARQLLAQLNEEAP